MSRFRKIKMQPISSLGPEGTFSHYAAQKYIKLPSILFNSSIRGVFKDVDKGRAELGIVPVENSIGGSIGEVMNYLMEFEMYIKDEVLLKVHHNIAGNSELKDIKKIFVHSQTLMQCQRFIEKNLDNPVLIRTKSNSDSAMKLGAKIAAKETAYGAIIPQNSSEIYPLNVLRRSIEDYKNNVTRFFVITKQLSTKSTGNDRTSIIAIPRVEKPGLLFNALKVFAESDINLTKIESRPSKEKLGLYIFHIDFWGHYKDACVMSTLDKLKKFIKIKILGSYPRKY
jgi:chorismate mutase / prephenate dehydratase